MAEDEFAIIRRYFEGIGKPRDTTRLGIGDDAAVVELPPGMQQVMSMDTLIGGVHFPTQTAPRDIAHKALAVNLSDLAAMAATPAWFLLSLSIPEADDGWLQDFSAGLCETAIKHDIELVGGDTCRGQLSITIQVTGLVPNEAWVGRAGARPGDLVVVSGQLGNAGLGLAHLQGRVRLPEEHRDTCLQALNRPRPRLDLVGFLREFATAAIDISDGLRGDLAHLLDASDCGAEIERAALPMNPWARREQLHDYALAAGDDYEICCTVPGRYQSEIDDWNRHNPEHGLTVIGEIVGSGFRLRTDDDWIDLRDSGGFRHFH